MDTFVSYLPEELYLITISYIHDIHDILNLIDIYPQKTILLLKNLDILTNNKDIIHIPFKVFKESTKLIYNDNNILFDIDNIEELSDFIHFKDITSINFYIKDFLEHEFLSIEYFEKLLTVLPYEPTQNKIVRLIFKTDEYYAYIIDANKFSTINLNQNRYIDINSNIPERSIWNNDFLSIIEKKYKNKKIYSCVYSSIEYITYLGNDVVNFNIMEEGTRLLLNKDNNSLFIFIKTDSSEEMYKISDYKNINSMQYNLKDFMLTANFKYINNKIFDRINVIDRNFIYYLIEMYIIANNLYNDDRVLIDQTINKYFISPLNRLDLNKGPFYTNLKDIVEYVFSLLKPIDKIEFDHIINLKLPPNKSYIKDDFTFTKDINYMKLIKRKISSS